MGCRVMLRTHKITGHAQRLDVLVVEAVEEDGEVADDAHEVRVVVRGGEALRDGGGGSVEVRSLVRVELACLLDNPAPSAAAPLEHDLRHVLGAHGREAQLRVRLEDGEDGGEVAQGALPRRALEEGVEAARRVEARRDRVQHRRDADARTEAVADLGEGREAEGDRANVGAAAAAARQLLAHARLKRLLRPGLAHNRCDLGRLALERGEV